MSAPVLLILLSSTLLSAPRAESFSCVVPWFETNWCGVKTSTSNKPDKITYVVQPGETVFVQLNALTRMKKKKDSTGYDADPTSGDTTCPKFEVYHLNPPNTESVGSAKVCKTEKIKLWTNCTGKAVNVYFEATGDLTKSWKFEGNYVFEATLEYSCK